MTHCTHIILKKNEQGSRRTICEGENHTEFVYTSGNFLFGGAANRGICGTC